MPRKEIKNGDIASSVRSKLNDMTQELYQYLDNLKDTGVSELNNAEILALLGDSEQQLTYRGNVILSAADINDLINGLPEITIIDGGNF